MRGGLPQCGSAGTIVFSCLEGLSAARAKSPGSPPSLLLDTPGGGLPWGRGGSLDSSLGLCSKGGATVLSVLFGWTRAVFI